MTPHAFERLHACLTIVSMRDADSVVMAWAAPGTAGQTAAEHVAAGGFDLAVLLALVRLLALTERQVDLVASYGAALREHLSSPGLKVIR